MLVELSVIEQRFNAVSAEVVRDGLSVVEVAERYEVSRQSIYTWIANYEAGGLAGLADRSHRPELPPPDPRRPRSGHLRDAPYPPGLGPAPHRP